MKKKTFIVQLLDSKKPSRTSFTQVEDALFYSNDTDASLVFIPHEDTFDFQSAKVVMFNRGDESLVERDMEVTTEDGRKVASYELPDEIISHWGQWIAQPVFINDDEIYSGAIVPFSVDRHLMHERPPKLTEVVTVTKFIQQSQELVNAMIQAEAQRITEEQVRQSSEENRVQAESERSDKYESYAQQFNDVITELSEEKDYHSLPEIAGARGGEDTLGERLDKEHNEVTAQLAQKATKGEIGITDLDKSNVQYDSTWFSDSFLADLNNGVINTTFVEDESLITQKYADNSVTREKISEFKLSPNLFDKSRVISGKTVTRSGAIVDNDLWSYYEYQIKPSTTYTFSHASTTWLIIYDNEGNRLTTPADVTATPQTIVHTMPATARKVFVNVRNTVKDVYMMVEGSELPPEYVPYYTEIDSLKLNDESVGMNHLSAEVQSQLDNTQNKWHSKNGVSFGDSITYYDGKTFGTALYESGQTAKGYQSYLRETFGITIDNQGVSGHNMNQIMTRIKGYSFENVDIATITSGANDWSQERAIGEITLPQSIFDETTFYGALQSSVEFIINANSNTKIVLITPVRGYHPPGTHGATWQTKGRVVDGLIEQPEDYAVAIKQVAELYGLEVIDFREFTGLNFLTKELYLGDDPTKTNGKLVHPNNNYYELMGKYAVERFKQIPL